MHSSFFAFQFTHENLHINECEMSHYTYIFTFSYTLAINYSNIYFLKTFFMTSKFTSYKFQKKTITFLLNKFISYLLVYKYYS